MSRSLLLFILSFVIQNSFSQSKHTISGYIKDASNGEALIGATVFVQENTTGTTANAYGFYSLTLPSGNYKISFSFVGYQRVEKEFSLDADLRFDVELKESV